MEMLGMPLAILLVFYLYLLVRFQHVKRPGLFLIGVAGLALAFVSNFFLVHHSVAVVAHVLFSVSALVAFVGAVGACFGGELPGQLAKMADDLDKSGQAQ